MLGAKVIWVCDITFFLGVLPKELRVKVLLLSGFGSVLVYWYAALNIEKSYVTIVYKC
jgi:hypothetical protein